MTLGPVFRWGGIAMFRVWVVDERAFCARIGEPCSSFGSALACERFLLAWSAARTLSNSHRHDRPVNTTRQFRKTDVMPREWLRKSEILLPQRGV